MILLKLSIHCSIINMYLFNIWYMSQLLSPIFLKIPLLLER